MTIEARLNLQKGKPEDKTASYMNYNIECPLDAYLIQKQAIKNQLIEDAALEGYLNSMIEESLEEVLEDLLKDF